MATGGTDAHKIFMKLTIDYWSDISRNFFRRFFECVILLNICVFGQTDLKFKKYLRNVFI